MLECASGAVYTWLLEDEDICGRCVASNFERFFIALASIGIVRLNNETLPSVQEIVKFAQVDDKAFDFWQEKVKILLNLSYKQVDFAKFNHRKPHQLSKRPRVNLANIKTI